MRFREILSSFPLFVDLSDKLQSLLSVCIDFVELGRVFAYN